jgi:hypothetical protein
MAVIRHSLHRCLPMTGFLNGFGYSVHECYIGFSHCVFRADREMLYTSYARLLNAAHTAELAADTEKRN